MGWDWLYNPVAIPRDIFVEPAKEAFSGGKDKGSGQGPSPQPLPEAPKAQESAMKAEDSARKRKANQSKTVYGDPLGYSGQASIINKTLTGQ